MNLGDGVNGCLHILSKSAQLVAKNEVAFAQFAIGLTQLLTDSLNVAREQEGDVEIDIWQKQL